MAKPIESSKTHSSEQPTAPSILPTDTRTSEIVRRRLSSSTESSGEGELRVRAPQITSRQASETLYAQWATNPMVEFEQSSNPFTLVEISVDIGETEPLKFHVPLFALVRVSRVFEETLTKNWVESDSATLTWPRVHPLAAAFVVQMINQAAGLADLKKGLSFAMLQAKFQRNPDEFDAIFRDMVQLHDLYDISEVRKLCCQFLVNEFKADCEGKIIHYFHWAFSLPYPSNRALLGDLRRAIHHCPFGYAQRMKVWEALVSLYEGDYSAITPQQKEACQAFLQDCFIESIGDQITLDNKQALTFSDCLLRIFPRFEFPLSFLKKINFSAFPDAADVNAHPQYYYVYRLIMELVQRKPLHLSGDLPPANRKLIAIRLLLEGKFDEAVAQSPDNIFALWSRAEYRNLKENFHLAHEDLDRILQLKSNHRDALFSKGGIYYLAGSMDDAVATFEKILKDGNEDVDAFTAISDSYLGQYQISNALRNIKTALQMDPESEGALFVKASCSMFKGDFDEALADAEQIKEPVPRLALQGMCQMRIGKFPEALANFDQILGQNPKQEAGLLCRAEIHLRLGNLNEALSDVKTLFEMMSKNYAAVFALRGLYHLKCGETQLARDDLARAQESVQQNKIKLDQVTVQKLCDELKAELDKISG